MPVSLRVLASSATNGGVPEQKLRARVCALADFQDTWGQLSRAAYTRASVASEQLTHSIEGARDHVKLAHGNEQEDIEPHLLASMLRGAAGCSRFSPVALDDLSTPMLGVAVAAFIGRTCCGNILAMHVMASLCGEGRDRWLARVELRAAVEPGE